MAQSQSHDQDFKNLILDYPRDAIAFFAAREAEGVDAGTRILPVRQEQLKERLRHHYRALDTPLLVEHAGGERTAVLFAFEEETRTERFDVHRLVHYCVDLAQMFQTTRVVPVVLFLSPRPVPTHLTLAGEHNTYLTFQYLFWQAGDQSYREHGNSDNIVARLCLPLMAWQGTEEKLEARALALRGLFTLENDPNKQAKYVDLVDTHVPLDDNERKLFEERYPEEEQAMSGIVTRSREEGKQEGKQVGEVELLIWLMAQKFGEEAAARNRERIEQADEATIKTWSANILTAEDVDDVFRSEG